MQDKELDELFGSKLDSFEVTPTAAVWEGITEKLDAGKRKKTLMPFLSIAASVLIVVSAGVLFITKTGHVDTVKQVQHQIAKVNTAVSPIAKTKNSIGSVTAPPPINYAIQRQLSQVNQLSSVHHPKIKTAVTTVKRPAPVVQPKPVKTNEQPMLAAIEPKQEITAPVVPGNETEIAIKQSVVENSEFITKPVLAVATLLAESKPTETTTPAKKKHKIRSLGDIINVVVAQVDKRKDKFIEFTDNADDESNITAVNLGIIKVKK